MRKQLKILNIEYLKPNFKKWFVYFSKLLLTSNLCSF